jgi:hypothetical protein
MTVAAASPLPPVVQPPLMTVVVVIGTVRTRPTAALASLLGQARAQEVDVLLVETAPVGTPPLPGSDNPQVRTIRVAEHLDTGGIRAQVVRCVQTPLVAFVEEHVYLLPGWLAAVLAAFESGPWAAVCGGLQFSTPAADAAAQATAQNFAPWLENSTSGVRPLLIGRNTAYRRDVLLALGDDLPRLLLADSLIYARLTQAGHQLYYTAAAQAYHRNELTLPVMFNDYAVYHACLGWARAADMGWAERLLRTAALPLFIAKRTLDSLRIHRRYAKLAARPWAARLGVALWIHSAEAWGLLRGYLGLVGDRRAQLRANEVNRREREGIPGIDDAAQETGEARFAPRPGQRGLA